MKLLVAIAFAMLPIASHAQVTYGYAASFQPPTQSYPGPWINLIAVTQPNLGRVCRQSLTFEALVAPSNYQIRNLVNGAQNALFATTFNAGFTTINWVSWCNGSTVQWQIRADLPFPGQIGNFTLVNIIAIEGP